MPSACIRRTLRDCVRTFRPLHALQTPPNNLPRQSTSFVGRSHDVAHIEALLDAGAIVTIVGAGGIGKTRCALEVAASRLNDERDGAWFVDLSALDDSALVAPTILAALSARGSSGTEPIDDVLDYLANRELLLVLDNCEHIVAGAAAIVAKVIAKCKGYACSRRAASRSISPANASTVCRRSSSIRERSYLRIVPALPIRTLTPATTRRRFGRFASVSTVWRSRSSSPQPACGRCRCGISRSACSCGCSRAAGTGAPVSRRCAPRSTGVTTSCPPTSSASCAAARFSPAIFHWMPRARYAPAATIRGLSPRVFHPWSISRSSSSSRPSRNTGIACWNRSASMRKRS